jgi:signal transduction histidine kinase
MTVQRRVLVAIMSVTTVVVLLFAIPLGFVIGRLLNERAILALEHRADLAARSIDLTSTADEPDPAEFPSGPDRFALYTPRGELRIGSGPTRLDSSLSKALLGTTITRNVEHQLVTIVPIVSGENTLGFLRAAHSANEVKRNTQRALALLAAGVLGVLMVGWILARRLADGISTATTALRNAAIRLGGGDFTVNVAPVGIGELDDIATALTSTAGDLEELVTREQSFSADASHQLRTPIAGMRAALETELAFPRSDRDAVLRESLSDLTRLERTVTDLLTLAHTKREISNVIDPLAIATEARDHWISAFARVGRPLTLFCAVQSISAFGHTALLRQAIDALLDNALAHGAGPTRIELSHDATTTSGPRSINIIISDEGSGLSAMRSSAAVANQSEEASAVQPVAGGLGLPLTRRLVQAQGGRLITARPGPRPQFQIVLRAPNS